MTLLSPAGLWALAALALPLAIHLWRRPPRTVRLGSLRFLQTRARQLQNLRWREHALLTTRLGLLIWLALLLARPLWRQGPPAHPPYWALLDPAAAPAGPSLERLRALQAAGVETRLLAPGFPVVNRPPGDPAASAPDLWSLLREADAALPAGSSLAVFSPGRFASLRGIRPGLAHVRVEWINTPAARAVAGSSSPTPAPSAPLLAILILHDSDRDEDARCVAAAWHAIAQADHRPVNVSVAATTSPSTAPRADWVFWLSARPVPAALADRAANVFTDASSSADAPAPGWIVPQAGASFGPPVPLWRRTAPSDGSVVWTDGFGQPLLTRAGDAHGTRWHFASRFAPDWNDLPLGTALPASLRTLLPDANAVSADRDDQRLADPSQCLPSDVAAVATSVSAPVGATIDLRQPLWLLVALCFCLERLLSHRRAPLSIPTAAPSPVAEPALSR